MAARSPYPAIAKAFDRITVDGASLSAFDFMQRLDKHGGKRDEDWISELRMTMAQLIAHGNLPATTSGRVRSIPSAAASASEPSTESATCAVSHFIVPVTCTRSRGAPMATNRSA